MLLILDLFFTFAKIGLFTFGGGYAMIALIEDSCVERKKWIRHEEMMNITVIAESTPGPIAINCATFVGYRQKGLPGALAATAGVILPSFCIIYLISNYIDNFLAVEPVAHAFQGIKIAVGILITDAAIKMIKKMPGKAFSVAVVICSCIAVLVINFMSLPVSSVILIPAAAVVSLFIYTVREIAEKEKKKNDLS